MADDQLASYRQKFLGRGKAMLMEEALPSPSRTKPCCMPGIPGTGSTQEPSMEALLQAVKATMPRTAVKSLNLFISLLFLKLYF